MFCLRIHRHPDEVILAVCDESVLGQTFRGDGLKIEVSEGFYGGDIVSEEEVRNAFRNFTMLNIVGNEIVEFAIAEGIIHPDNVIVIGGIKHAQAVMM
ncbi:MAG: DUF424 family protein [Thermoplasmata archaeon]|nr:DUF424 family protein [Thermoplasmata archaeon]